MGGRGAKSKNGQLPNVKDTKSVRKWMKANVPELWSWWVSLDPSKDGNDAIWSPARDTIWYDPKGNPAEVTSRIIHELKARKEGGEGSVDSPIVLDPEGIIRVHAKGIRAEMKHQKKTGVSDKYIRSQIDTIEMQASKLRKRYRGAENKRLIDQWQEHYRKWLEAGWEKERKKTR